MRALSRWYRCIFFTEWKSKVRVCEKVSAVDVHPSMNGGKTRMNSETRGWKGSRLFFDKGMKGKSRTIAVPSGDEYVVAHVFVFSKSLINRRIDEAVHIRRNPPLPWQR